MGGVSDFLFARPSFLEGVARLMDIGGTLNVYNESPSPNEADARALEADWTAVADDLLASIEQYQEQHPELLVNEQPR